MYALSVRSMQLFVILAILSVSATSCSKKEEASKPAPAEPTAEATKPAATEAPKPEAAAEAPTVDLAKVTALLAKADALDGTEDKVVTKCAACMLSMDGKPEHKLTAHEYTMHFCAQGCADRFGQNLDQSILAMKIPELPAPDLKVPGD